MLASFCFNLLRNGNPFSPLPEEECEKGVGSDSFHNFGVTADNVFIMVFDAKSQAENTIFMDYLNVKS